MEENEEVIESKNNEEVKKPWFEELVTGNWICRTRDGDFELSEIDGDKLKSVRKRCERTTRNGKVSTDMELLKNVLISESLVERIPDRDLGKLKASTILKLESAIVKLYGITDFL